jgi:hypothetical protein
MMLSGTAPCVLLSGCVAGQLADEDDLGPAAGMDAEVDCAAGAGYVWFEGGDCLVEVDCPGIVDENVGRP